MEDASAAEPVDAFGPPEESDKNGSGPLTARIRRAYAPARETAGTLGFPRFLAFTLTPARSFLARTRMGSRR